MTLSGRDMAKGVSSGAQARARTTPRTRSARPSRSVSESWSRWPSRRRASPTATSSHGGSSAARSRKVCAAEVSRRSRWTTVSGAPSCRPCTTRAACWGSTRRGVRATCGDAGASMGAPNTQAAVAWLKAASGGSSVARSRRRSHSSIASSNCTVRSCASRRKRDPRRADRLSPAARAEAALKDGGSDMSATVVRRHVRLGACCSSVDGRDGWGISHPAS